MISHFFGCVGFRAESSRGDLAIPSARGRISFTGVILVPRLRRVKLSSVRCGTAGKFIATHLPHGSRGRFPAVKFVTRVSATSFRTTGMGPLV